MQEKIRQKLISLSEKKYKDFSAALVPNCGEMLGVRIPLLRKLAAEIALTDGISALDGEDIYFEEVMLRGFVIGNLRVNTEEKLRLVTEFVPLINNWSVCDSFCTSLKFTNKNKERVWEFIQPYCVSEKEFYERFGAVMLRGYFIDDEYIDRTLGLLAEIPTEKFYSSMAVAWAVSDCYVKFPEKTEKLILSSIFDNDTHNRAIRKICDSYRVQKSDKEFLKTLIIKKGR